MLDVLQRYAKKEATPDEVMRELCSHEGWFAPAAWAVRTLGKSKFEKTCAWGVESKVPADQLWLFTSAEAGALAQSASPGVYVGPVEGAPLFAAVPESCTVLQINPGSPEGQSWTVSDKQINGVRIWGASMVLERAIENEAADLDARLGAFETFRVLLTEDSHIAVTEDALGMKTPGMVFTTIDSLEAAREAIGADALQLKLGVMRGSSLFRQVEGLGCDGLVFNPVGPGPTMGLTLDRCKAIADAIGAKG